MDRQRLCGALPTKGLNEDIISCHSSDIELSSLALVRPELEQANSIYVKYNLGIRSTDCN